MPAPTLIAWRSALLLAGAGLIAFAGCSSSAATTVLVTHPTMIAVTPQSFLGNVACASDGPGFKRYVATLFDTNHTYGGVGGEAGDAMLPPEPETFAGAGGAGSVPFQLPSSLPTSCLAGVGFGYVVAGRSYRVEIDGYDTDDIVPRASGSRDMVATPPQDMPDEPTPLVAPTWSARCDRAIAVDITVVNADHCTPLAKVSAP
jgi:hypothetical protein